MKTKINNLKIFVVVITLCITLGSSILPIAQAIDIENVEGFDKGLSYIPVKPIEKTTLINFDKNSYFDDYAYLAAVPTAVFRDGNRLFSHPLLFYQDEYEIEDDKERSLNARQGINYFMDDWMNYCNGKLDQMNLINVPRSKLDNSWKAKNYNFIEGDDPYETAAQIALNDWSYSANAVIAVIDEKFERLNMETYGTKTGEIVIDKPVKTDHFEVKQTNRLNPVFHEFNVPEGYLYVYARCWYPSLSVTVRLPFPGLEMYSHMTIPSGDKDLQLYCMHNEDWMQVLAMDAWNQKAGMDMEKGGTYVYNTGRWKAGVTDIPTKKLITIDEKYGTWREILKSFREVIYQVDIEMYPGERITLFDDLPFDCRNVAIELKYKKPDVDLGFCLIGPSGEEILSDVDGVIEVGRLGGLLPGESYDIAIYTQDDVQGSFEYEISYRWEEGKTQYESDCLTDATEGAVLASTINAPLLYTSSLELPQETINALYMLGVENIYLVNLGGHLSKNVEDKLEEIAAIEKNYKLHREIYDEIREFTGSNDVVFSTIESWIPWFVGDMKPTYECEMPYALFIGPAAYCAAHHGTPVLFVDSHPELSSAVAWHNEFWKRHAGGFPTPTLANMYLTGVRVYDFLGEYGFDKRGKESIVTVAGQFNIGSPWDRILIGKANSGRFIGSPVDTAYWISRSVFYPALIFVNPAMDLDGVEMIDGSISHRRRFLPWGKRGLIIDKQSEEEIFKYPVVSTFLHYEHRFNERASKYWGFEYQCADGLIPGVTESFDPIDQGLSAEYTEKTGSIFPDMSMSDVLPMYLEKGGYDNVFSTNFPAVMNNVNNGVLLWVHCAHGVGGDSGTTQFWDHNNKKDPNPWRMYEAYQGSTEEPDTLTIEIHGILPALLGNPDMNGVFRTALDWAPAKAPVRDKISNLLSRIPIIKRIMPEGLLDTQDYYDGMINTILVSTIGLTTRNGLDFDDNLDNLHSAGFIANSCLLAGKYLHLTIIRHGSVFQVIDPWPTSWYSAVWVQSIPRDIILGDTVGEAFTKGISHVGILYLTDPPQWWWDNHENVVYFGDPNLRLFVPSTDYSDANYWEREDIKPLIYDDDISINGHMPYGAVSHPHEKKPSLFLQEYMYIIIVVAIVLLLTIVVFIKKRR